MKEDSTRLENWPISFDQLFGWFDATYMQRIFADFCIILVDNFPQIERFLPYEYWSIEIEVPLYCNRHFQKDVLIYIRNYTNVKKRSKSFEACNEVELKKRHGFLTINCQQWMRPKDVCVCSTTKSYLYNILAICIVASLMWIVVSIYSGRSHVDNLNAHCAAIWVWNFSYRKKFFHFSLSVWLCSLCLSARGKEKQVTKKCKCKSLFVIVGVVCVLSLRLPCWL